MSIYSKTNIRLRISQCNCRQNTTMLQFEMSIFIEDLLVASRAKALSKYPLDDPIFLQLCLQVEQCH